MANAGNVACMERYGFFLGKARIIAPSDFMEHTILKNVYAGNAMNRRLFYQYGILLPASPCGHAPRRRSSPTLVTGRIDRG